MIIAIDFDGTIVDHEYPAIGKQKEGVVNAIRDFKARGHKIIIWTCRYLPEDLKEMKEYLYRNGIPFDKVNENIEGIGFNPHPKIYADIYIDDRNIGGLPHWNSIYLKLMMAYPGQF